LLGGVFSAQFGMAAVYGSEAGLTIGQISLFVSAFYVGALIVQYPLGWLSDRMDRRVLIMLASAVGSAGALLAIIVGSYFEFLLVSAFLIGGMSNPLYSLLIAYTNDFLDYDDMAAASGGMVFINGLGAISGPVLAGWIMGVFGPPGYFLFIGILMLSLTGYAAYRMTQRSAPSVDDTGSYAPVYPGASPLAVEFAQEYAIEEAMAEEEEERAAQM